jgi:hypothetical protein
MAYKFGMPPNIRAHNVFHNPKSMPPNVRLPIDLRCEKHEFHSLQICDFSCALKWKVCRI